MHICIGLIQCKLVCVMYASSNLVLKLLYSRLIGRNMFGGGQSAPAMAEAFLKWGGGGAKAMTRFSSPTTSGVKSILKLYLSKSIVTDGKTTRSKVESID